MKQEDLNKPVAYDSEGRPLYAAPQTHESFAKGQSDSYVSKAHGIDTNGHDYDPKLRVQNAEANEPHRVGAVRPIHMSDEIQKLCEESRKQYPALNLSDGEFVILDIKRHPIGLFLPVVATGAALLASAAALILYPGSDITDGSGLPSFNQVLLPALLFMILLGVGGLIAVWVYLQNQFFLTNESVVQEIQHGLFSRHEQTVSLGSIEDASFRQVGIFQTMFNYGTIRLSTEGEETTYRFAFVADPRKQIAILNNAIESFKNGRPVDPYET